MDGSRLPKTPNPVKTSALIAQTSSFLAQVRHIPIMYFCTMEPDYRMVFLENHLGFEIKYTCGIFYAVSVYLDIGVYQIKEFKTSRTGDFFADRGD